MRYIKKYESVRKDEISQSGYLPNTNGAGDLYWSIPNEERRFKKSLENINCPEYIIKELWNRAKTYDEDVLFITLKATKFKELWNLTSEMRWLPEYEYKGPIKLSKDDLEQIEAEERSEKYNI